MLSRSEKLGELAYLSDADLAPVLGSIGPGDDLDSDQVALVEMIAERCPMIDLAERYCKWSSVGTGMPSLAVDGAAAVFIRCGDDLLLSGPDYAGQIIHAVLKSRDEAVITKVIPNPLAATAAQN